MIYVVTETATGKEVYRYSADAPIAWNGMEFATHTHTAVVEPVSSPSTTFSGRRILTKLEFRSLFPAAALRSIDRFQIQFEQAAFLTNEQKDEIRTSFKNYEEALDVNLDDPRWIPGLGLYVGLGFMTTEEMSEVLNG